MQVQTGRTCKKAFTALVWIINPATRSASVYQSLDDFRELSKDDTLNGGEVLAGFSCRIEDLFF